MKLPLHRALSNDVGMTLIEVIVAISIMGIIATAAIGLSITSQTSTAAQQRQELAVTIANQAMESVSALSSGTDPTTGMNYLLTDRTQTDVTASWAVNAGASGLTDTYPGWDSSPSTPPSPTVPITSPPLGQSGTTYTTHTLIGTCYAQRPASGAISSSGCTKAPGYSGTTPPVAVPANMTQMVRVIVVVRWTAGTGCAASGCSYQTTSLVDPQLDLQWLNG